MTDAMAIVEAFARERGAQRVIRTVCGYLPADQVDELAQIVHEQLCRMAADSPERLATLSRRGMLYAYASGIVRNQVAGSRTDLKNYKTQKNAIYQEMPRDNA